MSSTCGSHLHPSRTARRRILDQASLATGASVRRPEPTLVSFVSGADSTECVSVESVICANLPMNPGAKAKRLPVKCKARRAGVHRQEMAELADVDWDEQMVLQSRPTREEPRLATRRE